MKPIDVIASIPRREADTHKGTYGKALLVAGSEGMTGAAILASRGAYRAGAGLVTVGIDRSLFCAVSPAVPEAIFLDTGPGRSALGREVLNAYQAVLLGPGIGTTRSLDFAWWVLENRQGPLVLDADGINITALDPQHHFPFRGDCIWTPHPGEFERLTGERPQGDQERLQAAERFVRARGGVLVLKGHRTLVMDRDGFVINGTGNPGMATAGAGDVLAGMIAAFLAQGFKPFAAARLAVHLHGRAGDLAAADLGEVSLVAGDLIEYLPRVIQEHQANQTKETPCKKV